MTSCLRDANTSLRLVDHPDRVTDREDQTVPIYDVNLTRRDGAATARSLSVERISATSPSDAAVKAIAFAAKINPDWADATVVNTDAETIARN